MRVNLKFWKRPEPQVSVPPPPPVPSAPNGSLGRDALVVSEPVSSPPPVLHDPTLQAALEAALRKHGLNGTGVMLLDLKGRRHAAIRGDQVFSSASLIKLPLMAAVMQAVEAGELDLQQQVTLRRENQTGTWVPPGDQRPLLRPGMRVPIARLLELMITRSDNVATNTLMDLLSREELAAGFADFGAKDTRLVRKLSAGNTVPDPAYVEGRNETTAQDVVAMMQGVAEGSLVSSAASAKMKAWLGGQLDRDKLPSGLPSAARVYSKSGETSQVTHEVMLVEAPSARYILAVLTPLSPGGNTWRKFGAFSKDVWSALNAPQPEVQADASKGVPPGSSGAGSRRPHRPQKVR